MANSALAVMVPELMSTAESMKVRRPSARASVAPLVKTRTAAGGSPSSAWRSWSRSRSGRVKVTRIGFIWVMVTSAVVSLARTRLPGVTGMAPSRPLIGAVMTV